MSPTSSPRMRALQTAIDAADWPAVARLFAPHANYELSGRPPLAGREAIERYYREQRDVAEGVHEIEGALEDAAHGACWGRLRGRRRSDGAAFELRYADICDFDAQGLIVRRRVYLLA